MKSPPLLAVIASKSIETAKKALTSETAMLIKQNVVSMSKSAANGAREAAKSIHKIIARKTTSTFVGDAGLFLKRGHNTPHGTTRAISDSILKDASNKIMLTTSTIKELRLTKIFGKSAQAKASREQLWRVLNTRAKLRWIRDGKLPENINELLGKKGFGLADAKMVSAASRRQNPIVTTNKRLKTQLSSNAARKQAVGDPKVLVIGDDIRNALDIKGLIQ